MQQLREPASGKVGEVYLAQAEFRKRKSASLIAEPIPWSLKRRFEIATLKLEEKPRIDNAAFRKQRVRLLKKLEH